MNAKLIRNFGIAASFALLAGCAQQGTILGRLEVPGEKATTPVTMNWNTPGFSGGGTMSVHVPSGELYTGKYLQITSSTSANTLGGGGYMGGWGGGWGGGHGRWVATVRMAAWRAGVGWFARAADGRGEDVGARRDVCCAQRGGRRGQVHRRGAHGQVPEHG